VYHGKDQMEEAFKNEPVDLDFGPLGRLPHFDTHDHPKVMLKRISELDWKDKLREKDPPGMVREPHKDEKLKYRLLTSIESITGIDFNHKNWRKIVRS
jgi:hypothetical protein